ncbi:MAG: phosphoethanolamine transferase [Firmicutes bacterium]|nr:phosphoethanolamine transferase [Bacillota bacterium]MCM1401580.1 phosphoethanolamine transferase [Bacteroides sp.]MCM1477464.1 phosphoethanolamine transferase [Bacteroides sp.]
MKLPMYRATPPLNAVIFWLLLSVSYVLLFTTIEFLGSPVAGLAGWISIAGQWLVVGTATAALIGLLMFSRLVFLIASPLLLTASVVAAYYKITMGVSVTATTVELAAVNDFATWGSVISPLLIVLTILSLAAGCYMGYFRLMRVAYFTPPWLWLCGFLLILLIPTMLIPRLKAPIAARIPFSFYYAVKDYKANCRAVSEQRNTFATTPATAAAKAPTVVFVIGESLRPDHLQLNGYHRATTPRLSADTAVVSLPKMFTGPCYTHVSVPRIMTRADSLNPDRAYTEQSFITLFDKAGYRTAWLSNQDAVNTYAYFMHEADTLVQQGGTRSLYDYSKWLDADLLPALDNLLEKGTEPKLAVMHTIGSHWWYPAHYPDSLARFRPEVDSRIVSELSQEQMINSYDNTILATDSFLADVIDRLRCRNALLIYISDHGEALGENGHYLHGADYPQLHTTACLVWYSAEFARLYPQKVKALKENAGRAWTTDAMFHTALHGASITTPVVNPQLSLFNQ